MPTMPPQSDKLLYAGTSGMYPLGWWHNQHWIEGFMETRLHEAWQWGGDIYDVGKEPWSIE